MQVWHLEKGAACSSQAPLQQYQVGFYMVYVGVVILGSFPT